MFALAVLMVVVPPSLIVLASARMPVFVTGPVIVRMAASAGLRPGLTLLPAVRMLLVRALFGSLVVERVLARAHQPLAG